MNDFSFNVSYTVDRCCVCPHFREAYDDSPYCIHIFAPRSIEDRLEHKYIEEIHEDCPERPSPDDCED